MFKREVFIFIFLTFCSALFAEKDLTVPVLKGEIVLITPLFSNTGEGGKWTVDILIRLYAPDGGDNYFDIYNALDELLVEVPMLGLLKYTVPEDGGLRIQSTGDISVRVKEEPINYENLKINIRAR